MYMSFIHVGCAFGFQSSGTDLVRLLSLSLSVNSVSFGQAQKNSLAHSHTFTHFLYTSHFSHNFHTFLHTFSNFQIFKHTFTHFSNPLLHTPTHILINTHTHSDKISLHGNARLRETAQAMTGFLTSQVLPQVKLPNEELLAVYEECSSQLESIVLAKV